MFSLTVRRLPIPVARPLVVMSRTMATSINAPITDYKKYLSQTALLREPSPIRALTPLSLLPGMLSLGGGLPNAKLFPFQSLSFTLHDGRTIQLTEQELAESLQYSATPGLPCLLKILTEMQKTEHRPQLPDASWSVCVTVGSQDALTKCFEMLLSPGDSILVDDPTYTGAISYLKPLGIKMVGLKTDAYGVIPESLAQTLASWPSHLKKPRVLYTIPTGQNPAGSTSSYERKQKIYALACQYDIIIMEDDPYYYLYYGDKPAPTSDDTSFTRPELKSYWSMDIEGRVIRFDSFSKNLSSGLRLGYATGPKSLIDQMCLTTQATNLHPSGISQMLAYKYLATIGLDGWRKQTNAVSLFYARRRDHFMSLCQKHLNRLAEWDAPTAGMFVWFKLKGINDTKALIEKKAIDAKVILLWGNAFSPSDSPSSYVRASFSIATPEQQDEALRRFAKLIRDELALQKQSKL